jgi:hypothetical protein
MNTQELLDKLQNSPQVRQSIAQAVDRLSQNPKLTPEVIDEMMKMFEFVMQRPDSYADFRQQAMESGVMGPGDLPEQFDPVVIGIILLALHMLRQRMAGEQPMQQMPQSEQPMQQFARGGLSSVAAQGRNGDTMLAHINPFEAKILQAYGGSGGVNPRTGLREYGMLDDLWGGVKDLVKTIGPVLPLALNFIAPGFGGAIGSALGASSAWAPALGGAVLGGGLSALTGGSPVTGALMGGLGGGAGGAGSGLGLNLKTAAMTLPAISALGAMQQPESPQAAAPGRTAAQEEYFNRPMQTFDWDRVSREAASAGLDPNAYVSRNWNKFSTGAYNVPVNMAHGGALSKVAYLAQGSGSGRDDTIDARLSDGEYVFDAETVALLGDGSTRAGAQSLDQMRQQIRKQKGAALAQGKFSPDAKSPLSYLKEAA